MVSEILELPEWRDRYIVFCPTCEQETMPFRNGTCGFCDTLLVEKTQAGREPGEKACAVCGDGFSSVGNRNFERQLYCSTRCKWRAYRERKYVAAVPGPPQLCAECGTPFVANTRNPGTQLYCQRACRMRVASRRHEDKQRALRLAALGVAA